jgi:hypothetical protein
MNRQSNTRLFDDYPIRIAVIAVRVNDFLQPVAENVALT